MTRIPFTASTFLSLFFSLTFIGVAHAGGCCSWHGGVAGCNAQSGHDLCQDGTDSPSCTCAAPQHSSSSSSSEENVSSTPADSYSSVDTPKTAAGFSDVSLSSPYYAAILWAQQSGIIQGYNDGTFRPYSPINRAELMKILVSGQATANANSNTSCFPDVGSADWFSPYICSAYNLKWVQGYPDGRFHPENNLNDAEALKMIVVSNVSADQTSRDGCDTSQWYGTYLCTGEAHHILTADQFDPNETISRGKVTLWLYETSQGGQRESSSVTTSVQQTGQTKTAGCVVNGPYPDHACTPGAVFSDVTMDQVCTPGYSSGVRNVPKSEKDKVYAEYGIQSHVTGEYEVDHFISLELGGTNDISNLWPEAASPTPGFHEKDKVENYLHKQVCNGSISLSEAQTEISTDWMSVYQQMTK